MGRGNKARDTAPEEQLRKALWALGARFRVHYSDVPGRPDVAFPRQKVAVFCDGDFWHGNDWSRRAQKLATGANSEYWLRKIQYNRSRDKEINAMLTELGWLVVRLWESDVRKDARTLAARVLSLVKART